MKKIYLYLIIFLLVPSVGHAATYYGCASANINADSTFCATPSGSCAGSDAVTAATALAGTHTLYANGCTITVNASFTAVKISTMDGDGAGAAVAGGAFNVATSTSPLTVTADREAGSTDCLTVTGSANANPALTLIGGDAGSTTTTGKCGTYDGHTVGNVVVTSGNAVGGLGQGYLTNSSTGTVSYTGTCTGSSTANAPGCQASGAAGITLVGNSVAGTRAQGIAGNIIWGGAATNYVQIKTAASTTNMYNDIPDAGNVTEDDTVAGVTGSYHEAAENEVKSGTTFGAASALTGTYSGGGGGGAWAF